MSTGIVWFRNDLRVHDHPALAAAIKRHDAIACVYVVDDQYFGKTQFGFDRIGKHRLRFLRQSLQDLDRSLGRLGSSLRLIPGSPRQVLADVADQLDAPCVYANRELASDECETQSKVAQTLAQRGKTLHLSRASTLYDASDLPFAIEDLPELFTDFRRSAEKHCQIAPPLAAPTAIEDAIGDVDSASTLRLPQVSIDQLECFGSLGPSDQDQSNHDSSGDGSSDHGSSDHGSSGQDPLMDTHVELRGGETAGLQRVHQYIWADDCLKQYKETRNGMLWLNDSSKFSPWLAMGCLSPRQAAQEVHRYEQQRIKNDSTYWMIFELLWRDYFGFIAKKHGSALFRRGGLRRRDLPWDQNWDLFDRWRNGTTGFPLIDANMRQLKATGYMSNRGRQNVASFLTKNLSIDWRMGAQWFESMLIDYDPCSNYGNWNYSAGVGNDARGFRWFNTIKQSEQYDPNGHYVRHWLTELRSVPDQFIHCPWKMNRADRDRVAAGYPDRIVDLFESAKRNEAKFKARGKSG